jgi:hypothetical protein
MKLKLKLELMNPKATMPAWVIDAIQVEEDMTKQCLERCKQLELETRKAELEARTAELEARKTETELDILRLKIAHNITT